jgi:RNA polymerase sigma factor (TIGR02999 family)
MIIFSLVRGGRIRVADQDFGIPFLLVDAKIVRRLDHSRRRNTSLGIPKWEHGRIASHRRVDAMPGAEDDVTALLHRWGRGEREALDELVPKVYQELRRRARSQLGRERKNHTLQPTALVHETYLRLVQQDRADWKTRTQFFAVASRVMRRVLIDHARTKKTAKRGGGAETRTLTDEDRISLDASLDMTALDEALARLGELDPQQLSIVELRLFGGFTIEETADALELSSGTVKRHWAMAKTWLWKELKAR